MPAASPNRRFALALGTALGIAGLAACGTVDPGDPPADVNACRPSQSFFAMQIWPNFLGKDYGGKHCYDSGCHASSAGHTLALSPPADPLGMPLSPAWAAVYKSAAEQMYCTNAAASPLLAAPATVTRLPLTSNSKNLISSSSLLATFT